MTLPNDIVIVWGESVNPNPPANPPTISVSAWSAILGLPWLRWDTSNISNVPEAARTARVAFVNTFHTPDSIHIQQIKQVNPDCFVFAMPDAPVEHVLGEGPWHNAVDQLVLADAIAPRTQADCDVYGTLLNKPTYWLPSPIGPTDYFAKYRDAPKEDFILTLDHSLSLLNTYSNVAAVAAAQRATGLRVVYAAARPWTPRYAALAGADFEFVEHVPFVDFIELTARAKICIDVYAAHSYGRQNVLCAMVGTPCITSSWSALEQWDQHIDPFHPQDVVSYAKWLLSDPPLYASVREDGYEKIDRQYSFETSKFTLLNILKQIGVTA